MIRLCKKFNYKINKFVMETLNIKYSNKYLHIYRYNLTINGATRRILLCLYRMQLLFQAETELK